MLLVMAGCKDENSGPSKILDTPQTYCIRGVVYYLLGYSASVAYNKDSTVITCDMGNGNVNK